MESFVYYAPTEVIFGRGAEEKRGTRPENGKYGNARARYRNGGRNCLCRIYDKAHGVRW